MPSTLTFPGVYIEEIPSGVRTITGVATSITAFLGRAIRGPVNTPVVINSNADFQRVFGGLWLESTLGYAVSDFFLNGGSQAIIVRLFSPQTGGGAVAGRAQLNVGGLSLEATDEGAWGRSLRATLNQDIPQEVADEMGLPVGDLFNLIVREVDANEAVIRSETFSNVSVRESSRRIDRVLKDDSLLVRWRGVFPLPAALPAITAGDDAVTVEAKKLPDAKKDIVDAQKNLKAAQALDPPDPAAVAAAQQALDDANAALAQINQDLNAARTAIVGGSNGLALTEATFTGPGSEANKTGLYALENADLFNLLCIPPYRQGGDIDDTLIGAAAAYCEKKRAMLIVDPPASWNTVQEVIDGLPDIGTSSKNSAFFFPRIRQPNPLRENKLEEFVPCGVVAGVFARTDAQRGVWKAPAGLDATLVNVPQLVVSLTNAENGQLNPLGVNCLRALPAAGRVLWGSRTLQGNDRLGSEWKYIPVRRTALFIEESLYRALHWVVFEPNDEPLWAQIRLNVGAFMNSLFRQGAFQGQSAREAYFVKCDKDTTTQNDIDKGIVNILVGFAPLKPAEFVVVKIQQIAGQIQT
ncbi:MAG TPA: phage tail sheath C-terminal domain-containing protein, partial [Pyrinomonadaceae bacterium]|nr:phage tail sheath C-terminal domain-containing protein [Pyrinomonadaceae bacterium]